MQLSVNGIDTFVATGGRPFDPVKSPCQYGIFKVRTPVQLSAPDRGDVARLNRQRNQQDRTEEIGDVPGNGVHLVHHPRSVRGDSGQYELVSPNGGEGQRVWLKPGLAGDKLREPGSHPE